MKLRDKFQQWFINDEDEHYEGMVEKVAIEHEKIADDFAIGFAEWVLHLFKTDQWETFSSNTNEKLLQIYKKEKGL
jgi:hypothetical protein